MLDLPSPPPADPAPKSKARLRRLWITLVVLSGMWAAGLTTVALGEYNDSHPLMMFLAPGPWVPGVSPSGKVELIPKENVREKERQGYRAPTPDEWLGFIRERETARDSRLNVMLLWSFAPLVLVAIVGVWVRWMRKWEPFAWSGRG